MPSQNRSPLVCYTCGRPGHTSRECRDAPGLRRFGPTGSQQTVSNPSGNPGQSDRRIPPRVNVIAQEDATEDMRRTWEEYEQYLGEVGTANPQSAPLRSSEKEDKKTIEDVEVNEFWKYPMVGMFAFLREPKAEEDTPTVRSTIADDPTNIMEYSSNGLFEPSTNLAPRWGLRPPNVGLRCGER